jgi:hypothetical protein
MAIPATAVIEVEYSGSDSSGGIFDPGNANFSNGFSISSANTSAPVVTHSSYNFVSGDVGAWFFLKSGTSSLPGWYQIASVASNAATLSAAIGAGVIYPGFGAATAVGCGTSASLTTITGSVDYSQQNAAELALTGMTTVGVSATVSSTSATLMHVGNSIQITGGTNFTTGVYSIVSVVAGTSFTLDRNAATGAGVSGTGNLGGALATPGFACSLLATGNTLWIQATATPASAVYTLSATASVAGGYLLINCNTGSTGTITAIAGYGVLRGDQVKPILRAGANSVTCVKASTNYYTRFSDLEINGNTANYTGTACLNTGTYDRVYRVYAHDAANNGIWGNASLAYACQVSNCSNNIYISGTCLFCFSDATTFAAFGSNSNNSFYFGCIARLTVTLTVGFYNQGVPFQAAHCSVYGSVSSCKGYFLNGVLGSLLVNSISYLSGSGAVNLYSSAYVPDALIINCALGGTANYTVANFAANNFTGLVTLSGSPYVNAASGNFDLNTTAGAGAACRAAGYGTFQGLSSTASTPDIGAVQSTDIATGGYIPVSPNGGFND